MASLFDEVTNTRKVVAAARAIRDLQNIIDATPLAIARVALAAADEVEKEMLVHRESETPPYHIDVGLTFLELRDANLNRCTSGFGHRLDSWSVAEWGNAAAGECGEACNYAKKMLRFRDNIKGNPEGETREHYRSKLAKEIADCLIYLDLWAASEGIDLGDAVKATWNLKSAEIGYDKRL